MVGPNDGEGAATADSMVVSAVQQSEVNEYILPHEDDVKDEEFNSEEETEPKKAIATPALPRKADIDDHWVDHSHFATGVQYV